MFAEIASEEAIFDYPSAAKRGEEDLSSSTGGKEL